MRVSNRRDLPITVTEMREFLEQRSDEMFDCGSTRTCPLACALNVKFDREDSWVGNESGIYGGGRMSRHTAWSLRFIELVDDIGHGISISGFEALRLLAEVGKHDKAEGV